MSKCKHLFLLFTFILFTGLSLNSYAGPICGDGVVNQASEECDEVDNATAPASSLCSNTEDLGSGICKFTICGDNIVQSPNGVGFNEECDDGGASATCSDICQTIAATTTSTTTTSTAATTSSTTAATTSSTTAATTSSTTAATTSSTTAATTSSTAATTSSTAATTSSTAATTSSTAATTTTTQSGGPTTTTTQSGGPTTTTTAATSSTTTAAATTTTTQISSGAGGDDDLFDFGGSGCTISNTQSATMDPIWLLMLLVPGLGILRRHVAATARKTRS